jgi:chromosome segregation ATPase
LGAVYQSIFTEETEQEAKKAAQCKVTAAKLNFKDQIAQLNANVKLLKKSLGQELTGRQEFVKKANAIEVFYQLELRDRALRCWDLQQAINTLHAKLVGEERKLSAVECERQKLIGQLRENVSEQEKLDIIVGQYKQEKDELMNQYETLNGQVIEYQAQIDALQSSREHLNRLLTETAAEKAEIAAELKRITAERDELSELIQKQEEEIQSQQEKINSQRELNG